MALSHAAAPIGIVASALLLLAPSLAAAAPETATSGTAAIAALASPPALRTADATRWGAAYVADGIGFRLSAGLATRDEAERAAAALCRRDASACQPVGTFTGRCGAVARSVDRAVLFAAARPLAPASAGAAALGGGATEGEASRAALRHCAERPGANGQICLVVATGCGPR